MIWALYIVGFPGIGSNYRLRHLAARERYGCYSVSHSCSVYISGRDLCSVVLVRAQYCWVFYALSLLTQVLMRYFLFWPIYFMLSLGHVLTNWCSCISYILRHFNSRGIFCRNWATWLVSRVNSFVLSTLEYNPELHTQRTCNSNRAQRGERDYVLLLEHTSCSHEYIVKHCNSVMEYYSGVDLLHHGGSYAST